MGLCKYFIKLASILQFQAEMLFVDRSEVGAAESSGCRTDGYLCSHL